MPRTGRRQVALYCLPILLIAAILFALPEALRLGAEHWLAEQGLTTDIEDIDLNLFKGTAGIRNARAVNTDQRGFVLEQVEIGWHYRPLFSKRIHLGRLMVKGLQLDVQRSSEQDSPLEIAGLKLQGGDTDSSASNWGFGLDQLAIDDSVIRYTDPVLRQSITLDASSASDIASWSDSQPIVLSSEAKLAGGELRLQGQLQPFGDKLTATLRLQAEALPLASASGLIPAETLRVDGLLHADLSLLATYNASDGLDLSVSGDSRLRQYAGGLADPPLDIGGDLAHWQGSIQLLKAPDSELKLSGNGKLATSQLRVTDRNSLTDLLYLASADVAGIQINSPQNIQAGHIRLGEGFALEQTAVEGENRKAVTSWSTIGMTDFSLQDGAVALASIDLQGVNADLARDTEGAWNIQKLLAQSLPPEEKHAASSADAGNAPSAPLRIGQINLADSRLNMRDASVDPALVVELSEVQASLQSMDNQQPEQNSPIQLQARVGDYGKLNLQGALRPFATPPDAQVKGKISGIDTVPLSGFARKLVGHRIRQGTVSADLDINIDQGRLNSSADLVLNKLQVAAIKGEAGDFEASSGMPLSAALGLLRDRDENIRLKLPIKGDLENPDININDIIRKATFKAIQTAALTFYSPLGVISAGDKLLQLATALRFDPVQFTAGETTLNPVATSHLATLTDTLIQRPALQITLCGIAAPADREVLADVIAGENTRLFGLYRPDPNPDAVPDERLLELARARMRAVGDYMTSHGIGAERLILCDGEISETETKPGVRIEL